MEKILFIAPHLSTGGLPQVLVNKLELLKDEYEIKCIEWSWHGDAFVIQKNRVKNLIGPENLFTLGEDKLKAFDIISEFNPDIICLEEFCEHFISEEVNEKLFSKDRTYKIFETTHDSSIPVTNKRWFPDKFIFVSPFNAFRYSMFDVPYEIIEYPIDVVIPNKEWTQKELMFDPEYKHIVIVGLFTERKNQGYAFEMAKKVSNEKIMFHFLGNQADNFRHYWEPLMKDQPNNCLVWGERSDVDTFLQASDLFLFPSRGDRNNKELNPIAIKEAIKYDLPMMMFNLDVYCGKYNNNPKIKFMTGDLTQDMNTLLNQLEIKNTCSLFDYYFTPEENKINIFYHGNESLNINFSIRCMTSNAPMYWFNLPYEEPLGYFVIPIPTKVLRFQGMKDFRGFLIESYDANTNELLCSKELVVNDVYPNIPKFDFLPFDCNYINYHEFFVDRCFDGLGLENLDSVVDIGANVGLFAKYMYNVGAKKVILVEANPHLRKSIETVLGDDLSRSTILMNPVYKEHTIIPFLFSFENTTIGSNYFGNDELSYQGLSNKVDCETITMEDLLLANDGKRISLLKCDIEGGEYPFFEGITDDQINMVDNFMIEFHGNLNGEVEPILEKLERNNYECVIYKFESENKFISDKTIGHAVIVAKPKKESPKIEDYSQGGEQKVILDFFKDEDFRTNKFLDVGANDGKTFSNTYALALLGWKGVCLEPTNSAFLLLQNLYRNNKNIKCVNAGLSNKTEIATIHESGNWNNSEATPGILSSLHEDQITRFSGMNWKKNEIILYDFENMSDFYNLESDNYDFISIDVEGHEFIVLDQLKEKLKKCRLLCVEKTIDEERNSELEKKIIENGFTIIYQTNDNIIAKK